MNVWTILAAVCAAALALDGDDTGLSTRQLEAIWKDLGANDDEGVEQARKGMELLKRQRESAVPYLRERLRRVTPPDAQKAARSIEALDSSRHEDRAAAIRELEELGPRGRVFIERAIRGKPSLEARHRLENVLAKIDALRFTAEDLRQVRAIEVLEAIGSPEARAVLDDLAGGAEGVLLTEEARRALGRLRATPPSGEGK